MKKYLVGGAVRDQLMSKTPHDFDYTVVLEQSDIDAIDAHGFLSAFDYMVMVLKAEGFKVFLETPEHFTVRAQFPVGDGGQNLDAAGGKFISGKKRLTADFVLARKEGPYTDGRRPDWVMAGTLLDDLQRRDLTINAIAQDIETGEFIDPFNGREDILRGTIRAVGNPKERMLEDSLRVLRAVRFKVQLGFTIDPGLDYVLFDHDVLNALRNVSNERKMDELNKMFKVDSRDAINQLFIYGGLSDAVFAGNVNLLATMKQKGFNK